MFSLQIVIDRNSVRFRFRPKFRPEPKFRFRFRQDLELRFRPKFRFKSEPKFGIFLKSFQSKSLNLWISFVWKLVFHVCIEYMYSIKKIPFKVQYTVCIVCKLSSVSVPVSAPVPISAHVCFRFRFRFKGNKFSSGSVPVPVDKSVPVDH